MASVQKRCHHSPLKSRRFRKDASAVSDLISTIMILAITITLFGGLMVWFQANFQGPSEEFNVSLDAHLEVNDNNGNGIYDPGETAWIYLDHRGGEGLKVTDTEIQLIVEDSVNRLRLNRDNRLEDFGDDFVPGERWGFEYNVGPFGVGPNPVGKITTSSRVEITVIDRPTGKIVFTEVLQQGFIDNEYPPSINRIWLEDLNGTTIKQIPKDNRTEFRIAAAITDPNDNLPLTGNYAGLHYIYADLSLSKGIEVLYRGPSRAFLNDTDRDGIYRSRNFTILESALQDTYPFTLTAKDRVNNSATSTFSIKVMNTPQGSKPSLLVWIAPNPVVRNGEFTVFAQVEDSDLDLVPTSVKCDLSDLDPVDFAGWTPMSQEDTDAFHNGIYTHSQSLETRAQEPGVYDIWVTAMDRLNNSVSVKVNITVSIDYGPRIQSRWVTTEYGDYPLNVSQKFQVHVVVTDNDGDLDMGSIMVDLSNITTLTSLQQMWLQGPNTFSFNQTLDLDPAIEAGAYILHFFASDLNGNSDTETLTVQVNDQYAPTITSVVVDPNPVLVNTNFLIHLYVTDEDGDLDETHGSVTIGPPTYLSPAEPPFNNKANMTFDSVFHYYINGSAPSLPGGKEYTIEVTDGNSNLVSTTIKVFFFTDQLAGPPNTVGGTWTNTLANITYGESSELGDFGFDIFNLSGLPNDFDTGGNGTRFFNSSERVYIVVRSTELSNLITFNALYLYNPDPLGTGIWVPLITPPTAATNAFATAKTSPYFEYTVNFTAPNPSNFGNKKSFSLMIHLKDNRDHEFLAYDTIYVDTGGVLPPPYLDFWYDSNDDGVIDPLQDEPWGEVDWETENPDPNCLGCNANFMLYVRIRVNSAENPTDAVEVGNIEAQDFSGSYQIKGTEGVYPVSDIAYLDDDYYVLPIDLNGRNGKPWLPGDNYYTLTIDRLADLDDDEWTNGVISGHFRVKAPFRTLDLVGATGGTLLENKEISWWENREFWYENPIQEDIPQNITAMSVEDIDGDGDSDVVIGTDDANYASVVWLENREVPGFPLGFHWAAHLVYDQEVSYGAVRDVVIRDIDYDGDGDIITAFELSGAFNGGLHAFMNQGGDNWQDVEILPNVFNDERVPSNKGGFDNTVDPIAKITTVDGNFFNVTSGMTMHFDQFFTPFPQPGWEAIEIIIEARFKTTALFTGTNPIEVQSPFDMNWYPISLIPVQTSAAGTLLRSENLMDMPWGLLEPSFPWVDVRYTSNAGPGEVVQFDRLNFRFSMTRSGFTTPFVDIEVGPIINSLTGVPNDDLVATRTDGKFVIFANRYEEFGWWEVYQTMNKPGFGTGPYQVEIAPTSVARRDMSPPHWDIFYSDGRTVFQYVAMNGLGGYNFPVNLDGPMQLINNGLPPFIEITYLAVSDMDHGDVTDDDLLDLVVGTSVVPTNPHSPVWVGTQGTLGGFTWNRIEAPDLVSEITKSSATSLSVMDIVVGDMDGDTDMDIAVAIEGLDHNLWYYTNNRDAPTGAPATWKFSEEIISVDILKATESSVFQIELGYIDDA